VHIKRKQDALLLFSKIKDGSKTKALRANLKVD